MASATQFSFARGEIAPSLYGRVDTAAYQVALRTAWNTIIHAYGGASNRPGLLYVGPCADHTYDPVLIPFKFKSTDTYMLEFGDFYMRVVRNDSHVVEADVTITDITAANPPVVTAASHGYSNGDEVVLSGVVGMTEVNNRRFIVANKTTNTFDLTDQATGSNVDGSAFAAYSSGGVSARVYEIVTPFAIADMPTVKYTQSADVMTLSHPSYTSQELTRTDHDAWTISDVTTLPGQASPTALTASQGGTPGSTEYRYIVTAIAEDTFEESLPALNTTAKTITGATAANPVVITATSHGFLDGEQVEINSVGGMTELNGRRFTVANKTTNTFELEDEDGSAYTAYTSGGTANLTFYKVTNGNATLSVTNAVTVSWTAAAGAFRYAVYRYDNGLYGLIGETEVASFVDDGGATPDLDSTPPRPREPFRGTDNAPAAVGYFEQRRVFGGSNNKPDTSDYSRVADHSNFSPATPAKADDAFRATLSSLEVNAIRHYVPLDDLLVLTDGSEWRINSGDNSRFSIDTIKQKTQSTWGAGHPKPIVIGRVVLYVQANDTSVRSIGFELAVDGYTGTDLSLLANHIFRDYTISGWGYSRSPDPVVHFVRSDGKAAVLTFNQEQEVIAWARWGTRTPDKFTRVAVIRPALTEPDEAAYFVVKRTINGNTVRYIERVHSRRFTDVRDAFFVDSGLTFNSPVAITGVSLTSPAVVTIPSGHGLMVGDEVDIEGIEWVPDVDAVSAETQPAQLNDGRFTVSAVTATTISLQREGVNIDATAWNAYVTGGNVRKAVLTLSGYHHLAGETVVALADGSVIRDLTVSSTGQVTLPRKHSRAHVGFGYYSDIETLDIESGQGGTIQDLMKNVHKVVVRFERSRGTWAGPSAADLTEMKWRESEAYGVPTALLTGDAEVSILPHWNSNGRIYLRQRDPLPVTWLAVIPQFEIEDKDE